MGFQSSWVTSGATLVRSTCTLADVHGGIQWLFSTFKKQAYFPSDIFPYQHPMIPIQSNPTFGIISDRSFLQIIPNTLPYLRSYLPRKSSPRPLFQSQSSRSSRPSSRFGLDGTFCQVKLSASRHSGLRE